VALDEDDDGKLTRRLRRLRARLRSQQSGIAAFLAHPATLLVLAFLLTSGVGALLSHGWQDRQWERQQRHAWDEHLLREKYGVIDLLSQSAGEDMAAARDIVDIIFWCWNEDLEHARIERRIAEWEKARRGWRAKSIMLHNRVLVFFNDRTALDQLTDVTEKAHELEQGLKKIVQRLEDRAMKEPDPRLARPKALAALAGDAMDLVNEIEAKVLILSQRLQSDLNSAPGAPVHPAPQVQLPAPRKLLPPNACETAPTAAPPHPGG
jgi:hypothetical protein